MAANPPDREQETTTPTATTAISVQNQAPDHHRPHLSIDIPPPPSSSSCEADVVVTPTPDGSTSKRGPATATEAGVPPVTTPRKCAAAPPPGNSNSKPPQRSPSFMLRQTVRSLLVPVGGSFKSSVRLFSNARMVRTSSLPLDDALSQQVGKSSSNNSAAPEKKAVVHMCRSQSLPMNMKKFVNTPKSFKRMDSVGGGTFRVVVVPSSSSSSTPRPVLPVPADTNPADPTEPITNNKEQSEEEDIPEEEAVCRICMVELSEGSDTTMKLECACRGELALAHTDCAVKWFGIKGTRNCEVCKREVRNLPVTLLRVQSTDTPTRVQANRLIGGNGRPIRHGWYILWQGTPILVIVSILAYFCFLEELLVARNGIAALAISLPFSCILGLFSSLTTTSMVARRYVWVYAAVQFLFVVFFTHLFYKLLHLQAVISIILATFAGFGVGMTGNSIVVEVLRWRVRRVSPPSSSTDHHARRRNHRTTTRAARQQQAPAAAVDQLTPDDHRSAAAGNDEGQSNNAGAGGDVENPRAVVAQQQAT